MNGRIEQKEPIIRYGITFTATWYIVFEVEAEMDAMTDVATITYGPFLTKQEALEDMPRVMAIYTSTRAIC